MKSNLIRLGKKQKSINLMKVDEAIKSNLAWQEVEFDNLMEMDETADHHLREEFDLMEVDEVAD